jgi:hypothetical protein
MPVAPIILESEKRKDHAGAGFNKKIKRSTAQSFKKPHAPIPLGTLDRIHNKSRDAIIKSKSKLLQIRKIGEIPFLLL